MTRDEAFAILIARAEEAAGVLSEMERLRDDLVWMTKERDRIVARLVDLHPAVNGPEGKWLHPFDGTT